MNLKTAPGQYNQRDQAQMRGEIERIDGQNHKRGQNIEVGKGCSVILTDTSTGKRYALTVASATLTLTLV